MLCGEKMTHQEKSTTIFVNYYTVGKNVCQVFLSGFLKITLSGIFRCYDCYPYTLMKSVFW